MWSVRFSSDQISHQVFGCDWPQHQRPLPEPWTAPHNATDLAFFLLARGDFAWLGYDWMGCGCGWDDPPDGDMDCAGYPRPESFDVDYGEPLGLCEQTADHVFTREWTKATVSYDCNTLTGKVTMAGDEWQGQK